jgi:mono/diheme cytochrome c family protein
LLSLAVLSPTPLQAADDDAERFFENHVRPIFAEHCSGCHGVDKQFGGLRLDAWQSLSQDSDSAPVVVAGNPEESLLIQAVRRVDGLEMPPDNPLPDKDVQTLVQWVQSGAFWPKSEMIAQSESIQRAKSHWAFQPIKRTDPPSVQNQDWPINSIDQFVLARLESAGLAPSPPASRSALIRRVSFVLTGLPPTADQVQDFVSSNDPEAYSRLVEELLASPHYGEKWARHWLDVARYSDSKGYVYAREERFWTHASAYRDWVVRFFNDDRPINDFLLLQVAADQAAESDDDLAAMGFLTLGRRFLGVKHDILDDRIDVVCRGMMGLTVGCARCHDHKFDPIPIKDYYSLYGVFDSSIERERSIQSPDQLDSAYLAELTKREQALAEKLAAVRKETADRVRGRVGDYLAAQFELEKYPGDTFGQLFQKTDIIPSIVRRWEEYIRRAGERHDPVWTLWHQLVAIADLPSDQFAEKAKTICQAAAESEASGVHPAVAKAFQDPPQNPNEIAKRYGDLLASIAQNVSEDSSLHSILYGNDSPCELPDEPIVEIEMFLDIDSCQQLWKMQGEVDRWTISSGASDQRARVLVDRATPSEPRVFKRGNPLRKDAIVPRQFLSILAGDERQPFANGSGRLELAQEIVSPDNPLTSRVFVNRIWGNCFGKGLVDTPSDFGLRASPPSHPELLDYLAIRFMDQNWSIKDLHRQLVMSATFQQADSGPSDSDVLAKARELDPANALLWRWSPHRLTIEELRDSILKATVTLDRTVGGKSVDLWNAPFPKRRTLYGTVDRQFLPGLLRVFDFANPDLHIAQRSDTTTPQQSLFFLNHPWTLQQARTLADSTNDLEDASERVSKLFQMVLLRKPTADELADAIAFVSDARPDQAIVTKDTAQQWSYGYGAMNDDGSIGQFNLLPHFTGQSWQGSATYPDGKLGWVQLDAKGGHPGNTREHAAIRRWTAQREMVVRIESSFVHEPPQGDGVRAFIVGSGSTPRIVAQANFHKSKADLNVETLSVSKGDTIDFIVDIGDGLSYDQFLWRSKLIEVAQPNQDQDATKIAVWDSLEDFEGDPPEQLDAWQQLAQVLIGTNEFLFVP